MGAIIAKHQITNGGPVILFQPENEFGGDASYMKIVEKQFRDAGIIVPFIDNDSCQCGLWAPGTPAAVNIYGYDNYPIGFDCSNPYHWQPGLLQTFLWTDRHLVFSPKTPHAVLEFQGGSLDVWGGPGNDACVELTGADFLRVFWKNQLANGVHIDNMYMGFGGTNWGHLSWPGGYTNYDYAAAIAEDRTVAREKYSESRMQATFIQSTPSFLTAVPQNNEHANGTYNTNPNVAFTAVLNKNGGSKTGFFFVRHAAVQDYVEEQFEAHLPTTEGRLTIPQIADHGKLSIQGRNTKIYVTDYDIAGVNLLYSTAEVFTWKQYDVGSHVNRVLVVYGAPDETNELALTAAGPARVLEGGGHVVTQKHGDSTIVNYRTSGSRSVVQFDKVKLTVYLLNRYEAYNYWTVDTPSSDISGNFTNQTNFQSAPIVAGPYLLRSAVVDHQSIHLTGDLNQTTEIEIISGTHRRTPSLTWNGSPVKLKPSMQGSYKAIVEYDAPSISLPNLAHCEWRATDGLPEIQASYDDSQWIAATNRYTNSTARNLTAPVSTYAGDYGFYVGTFVYRGHFKATGKESTVSINTQGGTAYGHSVWINEVFVGSYYGSAQDTRSFFGEPGDMLYFHNYTFPSSLSAGKSYVLTIVVDNTGLDENYIVPSTWMQRPRGLLDWRLSGHKKSDVHWKLTGNLGGSDKYQDLSRGPLNEGGLYPERQGWHLPGAPVSSWDREAPSTGIDRAGVKFYHTTFDLNLPAGYDIPLSLVVSNNTAHNESSYRCQFFVNGYQYGYYVSNIGPQTEFHVPQGILDYNGKNTLAVSLWSLSEAGAKIDDLRLEAGVPIQTGYTGIVNSPMPGWVKRKGAY
jgi:hypothetical protein